MKYVLITAVGARNESIYDGIREFSIDHVMLLHDEHHVTQVDAVHKTLQSFRVPSIPVEYKSATLWDDFFSIMHRVSEDANGQEILINADSGSTIVNAAMISAAFANGFKAYAIEKNKIVMLPVMKFSYCKQISEKKMGIMKLLYVKQYDSVQTLSDDTKMSLPLISYHINGNLKSDGLVSLGLVNVEERKGKTHMSLSTMGRLLIRGHIVAEEVE